MIEKETGGDMGNHEKKHVLYRISNNLIRTMIRGSTPFEIETICGWDGCPYECTNNTQVLSVEKGHVPDDLQEFVFNESKKIMDNVLIADVKEVGVPPSIQEFSAHVSDLEDCLIETRLSFNGIQKIKFQNECNTCILKKCIYNQYPLRLNFTVNWSQEEAFNNMVSLSKNYPSLIFMSPLNICPLKIDVVVSDYYPDKAHIDPRWKNIYTIVQNGSVLD